MSAETWYFWARPMTIAAARYASRRLTVIRASALVAGIAVAPLACSLLNPLDGFSSPEANGTPESGADAQTDGPQAAEGAAAEGGTDARAGDGDAGPGPGCTADEFCDDFERTDSVFGKWSFNFLKGDAGLALDPTTSVSPTRSLHMFVPSNGEARAFLGLQASPSANHLRVRFAMKTAAPDRTVLLTRIQFDGPDGTQELATLYMGNQNISFYGQKTPSDGGVQNTVTPLTGFQAGVWQRWVFEVDASGAATMATISIDGVPVFQSNLTPIVFTRGKAAGFLGALDQNAGPDRDVWFDDVGVQVFP